MTERPLVGFTLLSQLAVGAFVTVTALDVTAATLTREPTADALLNGLLLAVGPLMAVALLASLLHLGAPAGAWRALRNLRSSWLSREALFAVLFTVAAVGFAVLRWTGAAAPAVRASIALVAAAGGVALVHAMARVYRLRTVPEWDTPLTTVSFFATALLLGALGVGSALALSPGIPDAVLAQPLRGLAAAAACGFALEVWPWRRGSLHRGRRWLLLAGIGCCAPVPLIDGPARWPLVAAFGLALAAQTIGRYLFYRTVSRRPL